MDLLNEVARDPRQSERIQREAVASLSGPRIASTDTFDALLGHLSGAMRMTAALQLGSLAYDARQTEPALAIQVVDRLWVEYRASSNIGDRGMLISSLGNAGAVGLLDELKGEQSTDAPFRARLVYALRNIPGPVAEQAVSRGLSDSASVVRQSALGVCTDWGNTRPCAGLEVMAFGDRDAPIRERALRVIALRARSPSARAAARKLMHRVVTRDRTPRVRELALQAEQRLGLPAVDNPWDTFLNQKGRTMGSTP